MATTWGKASLSMVARAPFLRSRKNAACSSGLSRICCRRLVAIRARLFSRARQPAPLSILSSNGQVSRQEALGLVEALLRRILAKEPLYPLLVHGAATSRPPRPSALRSHHAAPAGPPGDRENPTPERCPPERRCASSCSSASSGQIKLRRISGWRKIAALLNRDTSAAGEPRLGASTAKGRISSASGGHHAKERRIPYRSAHARRRHRDGAGQDEGVPEVGP